MIDGCSDKHLKPGEREWTCGEELRTDRSQRERGGRPGLALGWRGEWELLWEGSQNGGERREEGPLRQAGPVSSLHRGETEGGQSKGTVPAAAVSCPGVLPPAQALSAPSTLFNKESRTWYVFLDSFMG